MPQHEEILDAPFFRTIISYTMLFAASVRIGGRFMPAALSLIRHRFGKLVVSSRIGRISDHRIYWECSCDCGGTTKATTSSLRGGAVTSCGCSKSHYALGVPAFIQTGMSRTPEYTAWIRMRRSCYDTDYKDYRRYGGRGIRVCDEWLRDFLCFLSHIGKRPSPTHSVDRFPNNNGNYEPGNVRWATKIEQGRNRRTCAMLTHGGITLSLVEWSEKLGIPYKLLKSRNRLGWSPERILTEPVATAATMTHGGSALTLSQWSKKLGISASSLQARIAAGWSIEKTLTTPLRPLRRSS